MTSRRSGVAPRVSADEASTLSTLRGLWPFIWPHDRADLKVRVGLALIALVIAKIVTVISPYFFKWATDALAGEGGLSGDGLVPGWLLAPVMLVIAYNVARVLFVGFNQLRDALFARVGQHAVRQLAFLTFRHLHLLSLRFHLQRKTGGLSRVIERGVKGIENIVRFTILNGIPTIFEFAIMAGVIWYQFGFSYVVVVAVMIVAYTWFTVQTSNWRIGIRREMNASDTDANSKAIDSLLNFETVKYFGNEEMEARRFDRSMADYEVAATRTWTSLAWLNFGQAFILAIGTGICMVFSAQAVMAGTQTLGDFVLINALLLQLSIPLNFIGFLYREIRQGLTDLEAMFDLLAEPAEITDAPDAAPLAVKGGTLRFEDVHFHYDADRPILKGISFEVPAGETVAIVGPSGAGKSTISRLLFRFYDVTGGRVTIDGQDLRSVTQHSLRQATGMVPQDTVLFNDTIAYNIRYGRPTASDEEVREAARMAQIADFIETLPEGFDTEVGERGLKLSGGEKQRVAIARTILKAPPILILDEATSALDTHTEREIQTALDQVSRNRTTVVIAHRLSTVVNAETILVLEKGEIVERGRHQELLAAGGLYASMWARQQEATEAEERLRAVTEADDGYIVRGPRAGEEVPAE
ncbi:ABC transporter ATP-binding protein/permease [Stappia taiwanensis]|uniref:ABC transporter ATP-binding protein/permease n=1 Tax=Stappia taiwanensis TaxID=992267 RepID=A0A838XSQ2_9HYPH|nr:ABC transporter ATP-binding protein/permease [Stappia taiwanensis]MBA4611688.1 ABC transporter ATP-binding protein/permease [Stappia taiwanensis]GGE97547.1 ABC transporter ATP-binding protein/permease [Stappia taiwanensis]